MIEVDELVRRHPEQALRALVDALGSIEDAAADDAVRIDLIGALEDVRAAAEAAQAALTRDLHAEVVRSHAASGVPRERQGIGVASQVALARRCSPHRGRIHVGLARVLPADMPHLWATWRSGKVTEHRARQILSRVVHLDADDRRAVDEQLAGTPAAVASLVRQTDQEAVAVADRHAYQCDRAGWVRRRAAAEADRHVSARPAPDTMLRVSALLPVEDGVAVVAALRLLADSARAAGDPRSRGQVMADGLVGRVTGRDPATDPVGVAVEVTVPLDTLVGDGADPAGLSAAAGWVHGYGQVPPDLARSLAADAAGSPLGTLRRLLTDPATGQLVAMESASRSFPTGLARFLRSRDRYCRTPWCSAPIRHSDHAVPASEGGPTSADNGQGLCEACNYAKQAPGWFSKTRTDPDGTHVVEITTPTGHVHESRPPPAHPPRRSRAGP